MHYLYEGITNIYLPRESVLFNRSIQAHPRVIKCYPFQCINPITVNDAITYYFLYSIGGV